MCAGASAGAPTSCVCSAAITAVLSTERGGTEPAAFVVRRMTFDFLKPARIDELLEVVTRVKSIGAASLTLAQSVRRLETTIVEAEVTVVLISVSGKPLRISNALREAFGAP